MHDSDPSLPTLKVVELKSARPHAVESRDLFRDGSQVLILHAGQIYTLRRTKENKLILTK